MNKYLFYFGCVDRPGHYLFDSDGNFARSYRHERFKYPGFNNNLLNPFHLDGVFTPGHQRSGEYVVSTVPPALIVSWHDRSVDSRPGSHSTFIGFGYANAEELLDDACLQFKQVMTRQRRPTPTVSV